jgi:glutathione-regulated potassium-efflux system ancillary protein KefC
MDAQNPLFQAFVFLVAAVVSVPIAKRLGLGSVLGYLIAGAVIGPFGLKLVTDPEGLRTASEFGVVIMLFLIGLELEPRLLWRMRGDIFGLGLTQVVATGAAGAALAPLFGVGWQTGLAIGLAIAISCTSIVLQTLREKGLDTTAMGRRTFAVLLFQDMSVIPMLALFPFLAVAAHHGAEAGHHDGGHAASMLASYPPWVQALGVIGAVAAVILAGRFALRPIFRAIAKTGLREIFTALALLTVIGTALLMQIVGLSPALGAFVAGVVLADSEFRREIEADIEPFRGLLLGLFFLAVGASIDFALLSREPVLMLGLTLGLIALKAAITFAILNAAKKGGPDSVITALGLAQGGEFTFVLAAFGAQNGVFDRATSDALVLCVALSMAVTPLLFIVGQAIAGRMQAPEQARDLGPIEHNEPDILVAGYGRFGQILTRLLGANGYRTSVLDHDADQIELVRSFGNKANYGDASRVDLMRAAGAEKAKILVIAVDEQDKALEIAENARKHFPHLIILARAFDRRHAYELLRRKVDGLERETFEGSVRLGVAALRQLGMPAHAADRAGKIFRRYDERLFADMARHWGDIDAYRAAMLGQRNMVEDLLRRDMATFRADPLDDGWDTDSLDREVAAKDKLKK